jgi:putative phosphoesterase
MTATSLKVGLISDTHGLLRPEALLALGRSDHIIHAGDICDPQTLRVLGEIAPVTAVRGNCDQGDWASALHETEVVQIGAVTIYVIHNLDELDLDPRAADIDVVVSGHSHRPKSEMRDGVLYINPGSAGPRRFSLPISVGRLMLKQSLVQPQLIELHPHKG